MKKLTGIIGVLMTFIGFITFLTAQMTISEDNYYTWTKPYTPFEARYITMKTIGIILLIIGILDLILYIASHIYDHSFPLRYKAQKWMKKFCAVTQH